MKSKASSVGILLLLLLPAVFTHAQTSAASSPPPNVAKQNVLLSGVYVDQARSALSSGDLKTVAGLLPIALEFNPQNSDALYLRALLDEKRGGDIPSTISSLKAALDSDHWTAFSPNDAIAKLAPLLIRTKAYSAALNLLQGMGTTSADHLYYISEALIGNGNDFQARNLLEQAERSYPKDSRFIDLRLRIDPAYRTQMAQTFLRSPGSVTGSTATRLIEYTADPTIAARLIGEFDRQFGSTPVVFAYSLLAGKAITSAQIDTYVKDNLLSNGDLTERLFAHIAPGPEKSYLAKKVSEFTGTVTLDTNHDGIPEESATYSAGILQHLSVDKNQNGVNEYEVSFASGTPAGLTLLSHGTLFQLTYGDYPFLASAEFAEAGRKTLYTLEPGQVSFPLFGARTAIPSGPAHFPPVVDPPYSIGKKELFAFASEVQTTQGTQSTPVSVWKKSLGDILVLEKEWNGGRYAYKAVYHHGEETSAEIDVDNDGYYEVKEHFKNGKLEKLTYDGTHKGIPEFTLTMTPYPVLSWDFNQDGLIDEVEKQVSPTTTILEFSTKMNGAFDVVTKEVKK